MNSSLIELEPEPCPRLAAAVLVLHVAAAALPWVTRCDWPVGLLLSVLALAGLPASLAAVPGPHCRLRRAQCRGGQWQVWLQGGGAPAPASPGPGSRVFADWVVLEFRSSAGRHRWFLLRRMVTPADFRRLKVRLRLAC